MPVIVSVVGPETTETAPTEYELGADGSKPARPFPALRITRSPGCTPAVTKLASGSARMSPAAGASMLLPDVRSVGPYHWVVSDVIAPTWLTVPITVPGCGFG